MKRSLRQSMAGLHTWSGLLLGWLLFAITLTGTAAVFSAEISAWMMPDIAGEGDVRQAIENAVAWLRQAQPDARGWFLAVDERIRMVHALFADPSVPRGFRAVSFDAAAATPSAHATLGGQFFYRFHFELMLPNPWGRILTSAAAMVMLVAIMSGIIIHKRIFSDFFTLRPGGSRRSWLDAHNVFGVLALPFHLMITFTGVVPLFKTTMPWGLLANYGGNNAAMLAELYPGAARRAPTGTPGVLADIRPMLAAAERHFGGGGIGRINIFNPADKGAIVTITRSDADQLAYMAATISFDGTTGAVIAAHSEARPARRTFDVLYGLHIARFAPGVTRWLYFLCGLALAGVIGSGLVLWLKARAPHQGVGHALVARLNVATLVGLPIAMLAFLWANRLLPLDLADRAAAEVGTFFWVWGLALLHALARPPRKAWGELAAIAAVLAGLLPFVSLALTGRGLWQAAINGDLVFLGVDAVMIGLALLLAVIARKAHGSATPAPRRTAPA
ncbi:PepSY-associated TM helix domain-containing protein [Vineibacter terrae]|uniref:PepSY-associated TM helix domain-containing protein n=1 Tax=Vineibacter terrae TaxID=2586908 RepID=UPI002E35FFDB|nr:PepSY-associated TM helix domain-containing protein [Vineibacter terrae]HEX2888409.1 PepSY-associated TM helix domain-containing protein [Vineibacter terrae]